MTFALYQRKEALQGGGVEVFWALNCLWGLSWGMGRPRPHDNIEPFFHMSLCFLSLLSSCPPPGRWIIETNALPIFQIVQLFLCSFFTHSHTSMTSLITALNLCLKLLNIILNGIINVKVLWKVKECKER